MPSACPVFHAVCLSCIPCRLPVLYSMPSACPVFHAVCLSCIPCRLPVLYSMPSVCPVFHAVCLSCIPCRLPVLYSMPSVCPVFHAVYLSCIPDSPTMLSVALSLGAVLVFFLLLVVQRVRTEGAWALWWHDNYLEKLKDFLSGTTRPVRMLRHVQKVAEHGDAQSVLAAVDSYCSNVEWAMNVGDLKGQILDAIVLETRPRYVLELGTYCAYSTVRMGRLLPPGARLISIEMNPDYAQVARKILHHAGLDTQVEILVGSTSDLIPQLKKKLDIDTFDFVFIDHWKVSYLKDTKLLEECDLLRPGSVLLADNVICPGAPEYLHYVRTSPRYESQYFPSQLEYLQVEDGMEKSVFLG
ncbi:catechol O-methyltransferase A-like isoform X4 [Pelobates fuscus]|uniref:catechol O-methyltransferase A-like isoform X4 n=1 Tax=Pelobates fuscus TaxID=191477 RepID=UPI002FE48E52